MEGGFMENKRRFGDRFDGKLIRDIDPLHLVMALIYPNRCDNEAFISERINLSRLNSYLEKKNANSPEYEYNLFQVIVTALLKTIMLRPKINRFIANKNMYQRDDISAAFIVKKTFSDDGGEGLAVVKANSDDNIDTIHNEIYRIVSSLRSSKGESSTDESIKIFSKTPRFTQKMFAKFVCILDRFGKVPKAFIADDPYYCSAVLTNLGSIQLHSGYHHLTNWGTTSVFTVVGERKKRPFFDDDGNVTMIDSIDVGFTVDKRIADGYYFSKTVRLFKTLVENPELLDLSLSQEVEY